MQSGSLAALPSVCIFLLLYFYEFYFFNWIFYLFTFQMLSPFPVPPCKPPIHPLLFCKPSIPSTFLCFYEGAPPSTHSLPPHCPSIPLHWGIKPLQDQGPPLTLMPDQASSAPSVLLLTPPLGVPVLSPVVGCLHICIVQEPLRR